MRPRRSFLAGACCPMHSPRPSMGYAASGSGPAVQPARFSVPTPPARAGVLFAEAGAWLTPGGAP